jgi:rare lipoprotein A
MIRVVAVVVACIVLVACSTKPSRYKIDQDAEPSGQFDASNVPLVEHKWEPLSRQGNSATYEVRGKTYRVLAADAAYQEEGYASWYGLKFHGELTSNGEIYDMYSFSAAHKSLPLPSYVRVTNLENNRQLVVRVNDRGPFHSDRIIDLSYAAAIKLGFKDKGTARVQLERLMTQPTSKKSPQNSGVGSAVVVEDRLAPFLQVAAFSSYDLAEAMRKRTEAVLKGQTVFLADTETDRGLLYRVRVGPFESESVAKKAALVLTKEGIGKPQVITRSIKAPDA